MSTSPIQDMRREARYRHELESAIGLIVFSTIGIIAALVGLMLIV